MQTSYPVKNMHVKHDQETHITDNSLILLPVVVEKESNKTILITTKIVENNKNIHPWKQLFIKICDDDTNCITMKVITISQDRYHHIHFIGLEGCRVYVISKLVKAYFYDCKKSQVSIREPLIGGLEFYCCKNIKLSLKIAEHHENPLPITRIESCQKFRIYQQLVQGLLYLIKMSLDIRCTIVRPEDDFVQKECVMGKVIWGPNEQIFVYMSTLQNGQNVLYSQYILNDISHNIIHDEDDYLHTNTIFGTTPPLYSSEIIKILK